MKHETLTPPRRRWPSRRTLLTIWMLLCWAFAAVMLLTSCGGAPPLVKLPDTVEKVVTVPVHVPCARTAPPVMVPVKRPTVKRPTGMICYPTLDAAAFDDNVERLLSWERETWTLCAPTEIK